MGRGSSQYEGPVVRCRGGIILASKEGRLGEPQKGLCGQKCARERIETSHSKHTNTHCNTIGRDKTQKRFRKIMHSSKKLFGSCDFLCHMDQACFHKSYVD